MADDRVTAREELAELIWKTSRADESTISAIGARHVADAVLAFLAARAVNQQQTITDDAVKAAAIKIIRWGVDEAREREAQWEEAEDLLLNAGVDDPTDEQSEEIRLRIEAAIDAIVPEVSR